MDKIISAIAGVLIATLVITPMIAESATYRPPASSIANDSITSAKITNGTIVNADVSSTAEIDDSKIDFDGVNYNFPDWAATSSPYLMHTGSGNLIWASSTSNTATSTVFSGSATADNLVDLYLSSAIGSTTRVVMLKFYNSSAGSTFYVRRNGDAHTPSNSGSTGGIHSCQTSIGPDRYCTVMVTTDSQGMIEWTAAGATPTVSIEVMAYW